MEGAMFYNLCNDLKAYNGDWTAQGFWVMVTYRFGRWRYRLRPRILRMPFSLIYKILYKITQVVTGVEFPCEVEVGKAFRIDHFGGIIISGYARFGNNCRIRNGVTVGITSVDCPGVPTFGNNVDIGAGAKILGDITIGDNVFIGANAVVLHDIPSNSIAVGVPAVIKPKANPN